MPRPQRRIFLLLFRLRGSSCEKTSSCVLLPGMFFCLSEAVPLFWDCQGAGAEPLNNFPDKGGSIRWMLPLAFGELLGPGCKGGTLPGVERAEPYRAVRIGVCRTISANQPRSGCPSESALTLGRTKSVRKCALSKLSDFKNSPASRQFPHCHGSLPA